MSDITFLQESHTAAAAYDRLDMRSAQRLLRRPLPIDTSGMQPRRQRTAEWQAQLDSLIEDIKRTEPRDTPPEVIKADVAAAVRESRLERRARGR